MKCRGEKNKSPLGKEKKMGIIKTTGIICNGALYAALALNNFEIEERGGTLEAYREDQNLVILSVARCLSDVGQKETTSVAATRAGVDKFLRRYDLERGKENLVATLDNGQDAIPCIAFCVCKYGFEDIEVTVAPISEIQRLSKRGGVFSVSEKTGSFNFDFAKIDGARIPEGALLRCFFKSAK